MNHSLSHGCRGQALKVSSQHRSARHNRQRPLRVMKFGGTSVADANCISKVVEIIREHARTGDLVVVVSAMAGVTNDLIEAANQAKLGNYSAVATIVAGLRRRHEDVVNSFRYSNEKPRLQETIQRLLNECDQLCRGTMLLGELTSRAQDFISSLGERLSAPLVAAALKEQGIASQAVDATELIVTNSYHGAADPLIEPTRDRSESNLRPLLDRGMIPIVTGFIGATEDGVLTTLGRGGSDYSAAILGAALGADEVIIWTDVDGLLSADPRLVPEAHVIPEISYREASELAFFGAKVLHPKTLRVLVDSDTPVWIRNTFSPQSSGTKITRSGPENGTERNAVTSICEAALIALSGYSIATLSNVLGRVLAATSAIHVEILMIAQSSAQNDISLVVPAARAVDTVEALRYEFAEELLTGNPDQVISHIAVAVITAVTHDTGRAPSGRLLAALHRENINLLAVAHSVGDRKISVVVARNDLKTAVLTFHDELQAGMTQQPAHALTTANRPALWYSGSPRPRADAD
ncbi:MAG TPA: aspartate kinase [Terriglobales bacterium]|nr:aspartate kinase [Terriglobales bacterium]